MSEQRALFVGGGSVGIGAADEFVPFVGQPDETGQAERADEAIATAAPLDNG